MNKSLFNKLLISYALIIIVTLLAVGVILSKLFSSYYFSVKEAEMIKKGKEVAEMVIKYDENNDFFAPSIDNLLEKLSKLLDASLFVINENGEIIATSAQSVSKGTILSPTEIENILSGQVVTWKGNNSPHFKNAMLSVVIPLQNQQGIKRALLINTSVSELSMTINSFHEMIIYAALIAIFLAIIVGYILSKSISKPIRDISNITMEMAKGNFKQKVFVNSRDEIGQLANNFNHLALTLDQTINALYKEKKTIENILRNMAEGVFAIDEKGSFILLNAEAEATLGIDDNQVIGKHFKDIIECEELSQLLVKVLICKTQESLGIILNKGKKYILAHASPLENEHKKVFGVVIVLQDITELRQLEQLRRDFVANVSHELRTPLTSIRAFLEAVIDEVVEDEVTKQRYLYNIHEETLRLDRLINELLDLSLIESGKVKWEMEEFDLIKIIEIVKKKIKHFADSKNVMVNLNYEKKEIYLVKGNIDRIQQVLINLISNGIQFSPINSKMDVFITKEKDKLTVSVKDNGPGIPGEDINRIWERFYRVDKSRARLKGGTGLGLAIVKLIVEAHGGAVGVESKFGEGSTFHFTLPI